ncbi:MAG: hypothetical protein KKA73_17700 [Chloroflexi bacterium]|nr:hypothetical protein [Chloroflexota bacterium]MBU1749523.1 hypothetical protein [Chloroflexota bacterium]
MPHRETFIVMVFCDPQRRAELGGRLRHVATNQEVTFTNAQELIHLMDQFVTGDPGRPANDPTPSPGPAHFHTTGGTE